MKWIKRLLILLAGLLLSSALILFSAVLIFSESDYKRLLGWSAERFLNSQLLIEAPIEVDISKNLSLSSGDILLTANDDSYRLSLGKLHINFRLGSYLKTGTFWFNNLELEDVNLEVVETAGNDFSIPPVVIEHADFNNVEFVYQESSGSRHTFSLTTLTMEELGEHQPVSLHASGIFESQPFELQATTDSIAQLLEDQSPQHIQLQLDSTHIHATLEGAIADPFNGRGLDLHVQGDIAQLSICSEVRKSTSRSAVRLPIY